jgi:hypothetical protein
MNTIQLDRVLSKSVKYFSGMYPIGLLQSILLKPAVIVINIDKLYMPGSHWLVVCFYNSGYAEYFYSYGLPPYKHGIMAFLQRHSVSWTFNRHRVQVLTTIICRHYCCIYALYGAKGLSMTSFVDMYLPVPYTCNDIKALRMFHAQFGQCPACSRLEQQQSC